MADQPIRPIPVTQAQLASAAEGQRAVEQVAQQLDAAAADILAPAARAVASGMAQAADAQAQIMARLNRYVGNRSGQLKKAGARIAAALTGPVQASIDTVAQNSALLYDSVPEYSYHPGGPPQNPLPAPAPISAGAGAYPSQPMSVPGAAPLPSGNGFASSQTTIGQWCLWCDPAQMGASKVQPDYAPPIPGWTLIGCYDTIEQATSAQVASGGSCSAQLPQPPPLPQPPAPLPPVTQPPEPPANCDPCMAWVVASLSSAIASAAAALVIALNNHAQSLAVALANNSSYAVATATQTQAGAVSRLCACIQAAAQTIRTGAPPIPSAAPAPAKPPALEFEWVAPPVPEPDFEDQPAELYGTGEAPEQLEPFASEPGGAIGGQTTAFQAPNLGAPTYGD